MSSIMQANEGCDNFGSTFLKGGKGLSMYISGELERQMVNAAKDLAQRAIMACGEQYNFDGSEAIRLLGLSNVKVERQKPVAEKKPKEVVAKASFPLPYNGEFNEAYCFALRQNNGLYTQCQSARKGDFCKGCQVLAEKNGGVPEYGTIQQRQAVGVFEYTDPKGRKPVSYTKVMKKYKVSEEQVQEEAGKFGMVINAGHFVVPEAAESKRGRPKVAAEKVSEPKGPKGRPKKSKKVLEIAGEEHEDLFAAMVANAQEDSESEDEAEMAAKEDEKAKQKAELAKQKEELAMQKAAELAKQKAEKEAKKAAEKAELAKQREAKLASEKAELAKQREAKVAAEKAEKEAKKAAFEEAKAAKKAALEAKKAKKEETKKKAVKQEQAASKEEPAKQEQAGANAESSEEETESISVKEKTVDGKKYLISKAHLVYDHHEWTANGEQVVIGKWNKAEKKIEFTADSESEESEEEYEEEE